MYKNRTAFTLIELSIVILIIGIITTGITQSSRLISSFRISSAQNLTKNSPVAGISGLVTWWEATSDASFIDKEASDGATVSAWNDINPQSNNKHNILQATLASKPIYTKSGINGLPSLKFDGTADYLEFPYSSDFSTNDFTIFAVTQPLAAPGAATYGTVLSFRDLTAQGYSLYISSALQYQTWIGINNTSWQGSAIVAAGALKTTSLISATYVSVNGAYKLYSNTVLQGTGSYSPYTMNSLRPFRIGAGQNESVTPASYFNGYIGELIIFSRALKVEERTSVEAYLKKKWGI